MASKNRNTQIFNRVLLAVLLSLLTSAFLLPMQAYALDDVRSFPTLTSFRETVRDGNANALRGIYVPNVMAYPVVQQPMGYPGYVSEEAGTVTQFSIATEVGNIGLLAHNHLAGADFSQLKQGDIITLVYGNGETKQFLVEDILQFQALSPLSPYSNFKNLENGDVLTAEQLFNNVYRGEFHLTLQTCIEKDSNLSWGRLFIIAKPVVSIHSSRPTANHII